MAVNKINQGKRNYARPTPPTITTATTSSTTSDIVVSWTPSPYGPPAANYTVVSSTAAHSHTQSKTTSGTSITMNQPGGSAYDFLIRAIGPAGTGKNRTSAIGTRVPPRIWGLFQTYNNSQTLTIPAGYAKMAGILIGAGGGGGAGNTGSAGSGGGGGSGMYFIDFDVNPGENFSVTVGSGGNQGSSGGSSSILRSANSTTIAQAGGGGAGSTSYSQNFSWTINSQIRSQENNDLYYNAPSNWGTNYAAGGSGGSWSSNVAGASGSNGANGAASGSTSRYEPYFFNGWNQGYNSPANGGGSGNISVNFINFNASYNFGGGGGASANVFTSYESPYGNYNNWIQGYGGGSASGLGGNAGNTASRAVGNNSYNTNNWWVGTAGDGNAGGSPGGGGGAGGVGYKQLSPNFNATVGGIGGNGRVYVYLY